MSRNRSLRIVALVVVVSLPLLGQAAIASAQTAKKAAAPKCVKHPNRAKCLNGGTGTGSGGGTGGPPAAITVQVDPNPLVETGPSVVAAVIQVETSASFADDPVDISSSQLQAACGGIIGFQNTVTAGVNTIQLNLDNDGNAAIIVEGSNCAPGSDIIEADLAVAPFLTAIGTLVVDPPVVTPAGVTGYPTTSGTVVSGEVETGDTALSGDSAVLGVFYVETDPVYAEQPVSINSVQLVDRCIEGGLFSQPIGDTPGILDDDGNAVFLFFGISCASGPSAVIADILAGTNQTYTTTFTVDPPQVTI